MFLGRRESSTSLNEAFPATEREANLSRYAFGPVDRRAPLPNGLSDSEGDDDVPTFSRYPARLGLGTRRHLTTPSSDDMQDLIGSLSDYDASNFGQDSLWGSLSDGALYCPVSLFSLRLSHAFKFLLPCFRQLLIRLTPQQH